MILINRRKILVSAGVTAAAAASGLGASHAAGFDAQTLVGSEDTTFPGLPPSLQTFADQPSLNGAIETYQPFGTNPPTDEEQKTADKVLAGVPTNCLPVAVAAYFLDVRNGKYGDDLKPYAAAWPVRWNPVIVEFFRSTHTTPSGDTTAWCAAFTNYCLMKAAQGRTLPAGSADPTSSAASRSFRAWAHQIDLGAGEKPRIGDLAVFREVASPGNGHVAFFVADQGSSILCLGGNQLEGQPVRHMVSRKAIPKDASLIFLSYRTDPQLHD